MKKNEFELAQWIDNRCKFNAFATVTFKQAISLNDGHLLWNTRDNVEATCAVIRDRVFRRVKHEFQWLTSIEDGRGEKRLHAHMAFNVPSDVGFIAFEQTFIDICGRMDWVHSRIEVKPIASNDHESGSRKVVFYMLKEGVDALSVQASTLSI